MGGDVIGRQESQCASVKSQHLFLSRAQRLSNFAILAAQFASSSAFILSDVNHFADDIPFETSLETNSLRKRSFW